MKRPAALRWAQLMTGLVGIGIAVPVMIQSDLGLGPWDAFHVGLHNVFGITVGMASILVGLVIVLASLPLGVRPGPGTLANMILIGVVIDLALPVIPLAGDWVMGLAYYAIGVLMVGFATGMYMGAALGNGPRDGLMVGVSRAGDWPIRRVRTAIELSALGAGWLMGGAVGVGTLLFAFAIGPSVQIGLEVFGVTGPRNAVVRQGAPIAD